MKYQEETREINGIEYQIEYHYDECPDLSWLGEFTDKPNFYDNRFLIIDRKMRGDMQRNEYRYFVCGTDMLEAQKWYKKNGYCKHQAYTLPRKHALEDYKRMTAYNNQEWFMLGIVVKAYHDEVESSLWGIESDSPEYHEEVIQDLIFDCNQQLPETVNHLRKRADILESMIV